jgi:hypothetical protein
MKKAPSAVSSAHLEGFIHSSILEVVMKLTRIAKPLRSVQVRVTVAGELNAALENYARYYEHVHGDPGTESAHPRDASCLYRRRPRIPGMDALPLQRPPAPDRRRAFAANRCEDTSVTTV